MASSRGVADDFLYIPRSTQQHFHHTMDKSVKDTAKDSAGALAENFDAAICNELFDKIIL